jgi:ribonuclease E
MLIKGATHNLVVRTRAEVALYVLNHKRAHLRALEERFQIVITVSADATVVAPQSFVIDRGEQVHTADAAKAIAAAQPELAAPVEEEEDEIEGEFEAETEAESEAEPETSLDAEQPFEPIHAEGLEEAQPSGSNGHHREGGERESGGRRRRRRGGRGRGRGGEQRERTEFTHDTAPEHTIAHEDHEGGSEDDGLAAEPQEQGAPRGGGENGEHQRDGGRRRRRRGRRGGRRNRNGRNGEPSYAGNETHGDNDISANAPATPEPGLQHAVEDLDRPPAPTADERPRYDELSPGFDQPAAPPAQAGGEAPRRRSTIRESFGSPSTPASAPASAPVVSSTAAEETATPKRGWWGRRLLGDKS